MFKVFKPEAQFLTGIFRKLHTGFKYAALLFFAISFCTLLSSGWLFFKADRVAGRVVDIVAEKSTNRKTGNVSTSYKPVIEYQYRGETYHRVTTFASNVFTYELFEEVEILVNPDSHEVKANTFLDLWFLPFLLACIGGFFALFAVFIPKFALAFQGAFSFGGFGSQSFTQAFKDMKSGSTEEVIIIKYKNGKQEL